MATLLALAGRPTKVRRLLSLKWHRSSLLTTVHQLHKAERLRKQQALQAQEESRCYGYAWVSACQGFASIF